MVLAHATWQDVDAFDRDGVVLIPTGSLEQHGPHLPLITDTRIVTAVAEAVEKELPDQILLTPTLWLGASGHHLAFAGSLSASMAGYLDAVTNVVESLIPHGFQKFYVLNGHGGNTEPNGVTMRELKRRYPKLTFGHRGYFDFCVEAIAGVMEGPTKTMRHSCEAEVSLMLHLSPELVRTDKLRDDGLHSEPPVVGVIHTFDEMTEEGSLGYATLGNAGKGKVIFEAAVAGVSAELRTIADGYVLVGDESR